VVLAMVFGPLLVGAVGALVHYASKPKDDDHTQDVPV
jgi:hypothetical protein